MVPLVDSPWKNQNLKIPKKNISKGGQMVLTLEHYTLNQGITTISIPD